MEVSEKEFERIVRQHKSTIYTVCYMFADNAEDADDMFQEVLLNVWNGLGQFRQSSDMSTWIWRVSLNTCISSDRKRKRKPTVREWNGMECAYRTHPGKDERFRKKAQVHQDGLGSGVSD